MSVSLQARPEGRLVAGFRARWVVVLAVMVSLAGSDPVFAQAEPAAAAPAVETAGGAAEAPEKNAVVRFANKIDEKAKVLVDGMIDVLFFDPINTPATWIYGEEEVESWGLPAIPFVVLWLIFGALFFTFRMGFINVRGFFHSLRVVKGDYDDPADAGEVSHFQALSAALSATVGLGNIGGVATAVAVGGPGAVFWMVLSGFFSMSSKFVECTLGQKYRRLDSTGHVLGGPMQYLRAGLQELGWGKLGFFLSFVFALLCIGASFGGGNMYQANQSWEAIKEAVEFDEAGWWYHNGATVYGLTLAVLVGLVILGGIQRIAATAGKIVPLMCGLYLVGGLIILGMNFDKVGAAFQTIVSSAFGIDAVRGGALGVIIMGIRRAAFSNEAGVGSAAIAHSAAKTDRPVREGLVALLEPFIDTIVVCTMTGLVIVVTGVYEPHLGAEKVAGASLTLNAFAEAGTAFKVVLGIATVFFAFSTMISWSYYGERCWAYIFGAKTTLIYKLIFLCFIYVGSVITLGNVMDFSDMMILGMALPNLLGCLMLSGKVRADLRQYWADLRSGAMKVHK